MASITMRDLLEAGIHFGHQTRRWNPKMARYIFGERHGIYIIDLQQTLRQLQRAYAAVRDTASKGGTVLFVGTKKQAREPIQTAAESCGMYFINSRWLGGTLTNWETIQRSIRKLNRLEEMETNGKMEALPKKEVIQLRKQRDKLHRNLGGIKDMGELPSIMFVVDSHREAIAVSEARRLKISCVAIVDTNSDPDAVPIPIPGNDDAIRAVNLFCGIIAQAAMEGRSAFEKRKKDDEDEHRSAMQEAAKSDKVTRQKGKFAEAEEMAATKAAEATQEKPAEEAATGAKTEA